MALNIQTDQDWRVWDIMEPAKLISVAKTGNRICPVPFVKRRMMTFKELATSGGVYTTQDLMFLVPRVLLPADVVPKPADRIVDAAGVSYTALDGDQAVFRGIYKMPCRNLVLAHQLSDTITIQTPQNRVISTGTVPNWLPKVIDLACRKQEIEADQTDERGRRGTRRKFEFILAEQVPDLTTDDRLIDAEGIYEIRRYHDQMRIDELPKIEAELMP